MTATEPASARANGLAGAIQFLTRVPLRTATPPNLAASVPWFPLVGGLVGLTIGMAVAGLAQLVPMPVAAVVGVLAGVLLTGAFHEDGLADVADAFAGGWSRDERIRILTDPLHGSYGVAAMSGSILLRVTCVATLVPSAALGGLVAAHAIGRAAAVAAMGIVPTAKPEGLGADYVRGVRAWPTVVGAASGVAIGVVAIGWWAGPAIGVATLATAAVAWLAVRKIGGVTGDVLGTVEQVVECGVLVVVSGLAARHTIWWR